MKRLSWDALMARYPALFALILFIIAVAVNFFLQPEMFAPRYAEQQYAGISAFNAAGGWTSNCNPGWRY